LTATMVLKSARVELSCRRLVCLSLVACDQRCQLHVMIPVKQILPPHPALGIRIKYQPGTLIHDQISRTTFPLQIYNLLECCRAARWRRDAIHSTHQSLTPPSFPRIRILFQIPTRHRTSVSVPSMAGGGLSGGTGEKLTRATIIIAGVAALVASLLSIVFVF